MVWQDASKRFEEKMRGVDEYLKYRKVSVQMRRRVQGYYGGCWRKSGAIYEEAFILQDLPTDLRAITMQQISVEAIARVPVLKGLQDLCAAEVYVNLYPHCFDVGLIYAAKEFGSEMYFIESGHVQIQGIVLHASRNEKDLDRAFLKTKPFTHKQVRKLVHFPALQRGPC